ncbi:MAG: hypothetical protein Fur0034_11970 [Desulfuromonadia bacterium]
MPNSKGGGPRSHFLSLLLASVSGGLGKRAEGDRVGTRVHLPFTLLILFLAIAPPVAECRVILRYLDGSLVEDTVTLKKGRGEVTLPSTWVEGSLRVVPSPGRVIEDVRFVPVSTTPQRKRELDRLREERELLEDRLKALEVKEDIFAKAARSQSARTPKKTKTNPDPLATIREGTAYAVAQLESVYRSRRLAQRRIAEIDRRIPLLAGEPRAVGRRVVITASSSPRVTVRYLDRSGGWSPRYRVELGEGDARLVVISDHDGGRVVPDRIGSAETPIWDVSVTGRVATIPCTVESLSVTGWGVDRVAATLLCQIEHPLPAGEVTCIRNGAYAGEGTIVWREQPRFTLVCGEKSDRDEERGTRP